MKAMLKLDSPDHLTATMTVSMTVGEWKKVRDALNTTYAGIRFSDLIYTIVNAAEKSFDETTEVER